LTSAWTCAKRSCPVACRRQQRDSLLTLLKQHAHASNCGAACYELILLHGMVVKLV
jgi:hypothetical protein